VADAAEFQTASAKSDPYAWALGADQGGGGGGGGGGAGIQGASRPAITMPFNANADAASWTLPINPAVRQQYSLSLRQTIVDPPFGVLNLLN